MMFEYIDTLTFWLQFCSYSGNAKKKIWSIVILRGRSQKKCTRWQHCVNNDAICPTISAVALENSWKLVQCILSPEVCARGNDRALKWRLFVSQVP